MAQEIHFLRPKQAISGIGRLNRTAIISCNAGSEADVKLESGQAHDLGDAIVVCDSEDISTANIREYHQGLFRIERYTGSQKDATENIDKPPAVCLQAKINPTYELIFMGPNMRYGPEDLSSGFTCEAKENYPTQTNLRLGTYGEDKKKYVFCLTAEEAKDGFEKYQQGLLTYKEIPVVTKAKHVEIVFKDASMQKFREHFKGVENLDYRAMAVALVDEEGKRYDEIVKQVVAGVQESVIDYDKLVGAFDRHIDGLEDGTGLGVLTLISYGLIGILGWVMLWFMVMQAMRRRDAVLEKKKCAGYEKEDGDDEEEMQRMLDGKRRGNKLLDEMIKGMKKDRELGHRHTAFGGGDEEKEDDDDEKKKMSDENKTIYDQELARLEMNQEARLAKEKEGDGDEKKSVADQSDKKKLKATKEKIDELVEKMKKQQNLCGNRPLNHNNHKTTSSPQFWYNVGLAAKTTKDIPSFSVYVRGEDQNIEAYWNSGTHGLEKVYENTLLKGYAAKDAYKGKATASKNVETDTPVIAELADTEAKESVRAGATVAALVSKDKMDKELPWSERPWVAMPDVDLPPLEKDGVAAPEAADTATAPFNASDVSASDRSAARLKRSIEERTEAASERGEIPSASPTGCLPQKEVPVWRKELKELKALKERIKRDLLEIQKLTHPEVSRTPTTGNERRMQASAFLKERTGRALEEEDVDTASVKMESAPAAPLGATPPASASDLVAARLKGSIEARTEAAGKSSEFPSALSRGERTLEENHERAYMASSRRSDRSIEARMESARRASELHEKRTGRRLKVSKEDVLRAQVPYEEEEDELTPSTAAAMSTDESGPKWYTELVTKTPRTHAENQELTCIAVSHRCLRPFWARMDAARRASAMHKERTGRALKISRSAVFNFEIYQEEDVAEPPAKASTSLPAIRPGDEVIQSSANTTFVDEVAPKWYMDIVQKAMPRTDKESLELKFIAGSHQPHLSTGQRMQFARQASAIHKKRCWRGLKITQSAVLNEEIYEEEEIDDQAAKACAALSDFPPLDALYNDQVIELAITNFKTYAGARKAIGDIELHKRDARDLEKETADTKMAYFVLTHFGGWVGASCALKAAEEKEMKKTLLPFEV